MTKREALEYERQKKLNNSRSMDVKQSEIGQKVKASIQKSGRNPALLKSLIMTAIYALELLIGKVFKMVSQKADKDYKVGGVHAPLFLYTVFKGCKPKHDL